MKNLLTVLLCCCAAISNAQYISGLYIGKLTNDSTHKEQQYELALSEYKNHLTGYAYTTFVVNDTFYYSVKKVKGKKAGRELLVEDVKILANNFPQAPDKGVRQQMRIPIGSKDTLRNIDGGWKTTRTKTFYSIGGNMQLQRKNDSSQSALIQHLYEVNELERPTPSISIADGHQKKTSNNNDAATAALAYTARVERLFQTINTQSDSLVLSFYDNGIVDGDAISVYLNGVTVISNTRLTEAAAKRVVALPKEPGEYKLLLTAENLGAIPPNTGLVVIQDGKQRYQVHFTADLQTNAVIEFKRE